MFANFFKGARRKRLGKEGCELLLAQTIICAKKSGALTDEQCKEVIVDTTVQEKNITFPTDTKLLEKAHQKMVSLAKKHDVNLRKITTVFVRNWRGK